MTKKNFTTEEKSLALKTVIKKLSECEQKYSDHRNGYFIVAETWGTCFFRVSKTRDHIEVEHYRNPTCDHSYTKIPEKYYENIWFVYVNISNEIADFGHTLSLPAGGRVIGMHEPIPSKDGKWLNCSYLVYSPDKSAPTVDMNENEAGFWLKYTNIETPFLYSLSLLCPLKVRHMYINEEGFVITARNRKEIAQPVSERRHQRKPVKIIIEDCVEEGDLIIEDILTDVE